MKNVIGIIFLILGALTLAPLVLSYLGWYIVPLFFIGVAVVLVD